MATSWTGFRRVFEYLHCDGKQKNRGQPKEALQWIYLGTFLLGHDLGNWENLMKKEQSSHVVQQPCPWACNLTEL